MKSGMYSLGMQRDNLSDIVSVFPVPVGPTDNTYNIKNNVLLYKFSNITSSIQYTQTVISLLQISTFIDSLNQTKAWLSG